MFLVVMIVSCLSSAVHAKDTGQPAAAPEKILWQHTSKWGTWLRNGVMDPNGNFVPDASAGLNAAGGMWDGWRINSGSGSDTRGALLYEHRSGALIPGWHGGNDEVRFIPELGAKILDLDKHLGPGNIDRVTYNRQDSVADFWTIERQNNRKTAVSWVKIPPETHPPKGWRLVPFEEEYALLFKLKDQRVWFARIIGDVAEYGMLTQYGDFFPEPGLPIMKRNCIPETVKFAGLMHKTWRYTYTLPIDGQKAEEVYEYRSGRLIAGTLYDSGNFAPEIGSTILDFKDYNPESTRRIYNLPGVLRKIKK